MDQTAYSLAGKNTVVGGAANGICRAVALAFADAGANVVCADVEEAGARDTAATAAKSGVRALAVAADVAKADDAARIVSTAVREFGWLDVLLFGAAVRDPVATVPELDEAAWEHVLRVNLTGAFLVSKAAIPAMAARGGGSLILIASQLGRVAAPGRAVYCTTKGALIQLAKVMAADHAAQKIRVNTLSPGAVETRRTLYRHPDLASARAAMGPKHLLGRMGRPEEIARAAVFLASDASSFMTGADLLVDGGYTAV